jgi:tetratricopeptide (TPR) repeat protein
MARSGIITKFIICLPALVFATMLCGPYSGAVRAQESPDLGLKKELEQGKKSDPQSKAPPKIISLDDLFGDLKRETDAQKALRIAQSIWQRWAQSGSPTVDLLMGWAATAIEEKQWATAFDLLDQVVVLAPQYAEGWNRRATLYFLRSQYGRSIHDIEQVLKLESRHFGAMAGLGNILQRLDSDQKALVMWKKVLEIYPANKNAQKSVTDLEEKLSGQEI